MAEIAISACDLAEVLGMAIGINLLFDIPLIEGVLITVLDTFLLLFLINKGIRKMEAFIIVLVAIIGFSFVFEMFFAQPEMDKVVLGLIPSIPNEAALYIAIGIIGATVMPHNLDLHSSLVQTRKFDRSPKGIRFFFQAEDGIRDSGVTGVQTCALPIPGVVERESDRGAGVERAHHHLALPDRVQQDRKSVG